MCIRDRCEPVLETLRPIAPFPIEQDKIIARTVLSVYPNPFHTATTILYSLPVDQTISITLHNVNGGIIRPIIQKEFMTQGNYQYEWSTNQLLSGVYYISLRSEDAFITERVVLLR